MEFVRSIRSKIAVVGTTNQDVRERERREEYFDFRQTVQHGFLSKSTCLCYSVKLNAFALATKNGFIKVFGKPNVEFMGKYNSESPIVKLLFVADENRLLSLSEDQKFCLWEIQNYIVNEKEAALVSIKEFDASGRLKTITCWTQKLANDGTSCALLGTESGNVYSLNLHNLELSDYLIYQDVVLQNIPDDYKLNPGAVEALEIYPKFHDKLLIGYNRGLIIVWDAKTSQVHQTLAENFRVQSLCWWIDRTSESGDDEIGSTRSISTDNVKFLSAHNDGSYVLHQNRRTNGLSNQSPSRMEYKPFGPFPLKPIEKILHVNKFDDQFVVFSGGMPRSSFSDKFVLTVEQNPVDSQETKRVCFDFSSKIIDFLLIDQEIPCDNDDVLALLVLCEEELVCIDLSSDDWPIYRNPYFHSIHSSPVTAACYAAFSIRESKLAADSGSQQQNSDIKNKNLQIYNNISKLAEISRDNRRFSKKNWPIRGGGFIGENRIGECEDFLVTGHEDGTLKFWSAQSVSMDLVLSINTATLYDEYEAPNNEADDEDNWPPFRKTGSYDPYSDDPRFAIQRVHFDSSNGLLVCGGSAGQVIVYDMGSNFVSSESNASTSHLELLHIDLIDNKTSPVPFAWKGREKLTYSGPQRLLDQKKNDHHENRRCNFLSNIRSVVQLNPPAALTALCSNTEWALIGVGTAQGFAVFNYDIKQSLISKCLLTLAEIDTGLAITEGTVSRLKSFKRTIRESFRRKRRQDVQQDKRPTTHASPKTKLKTTTTAPADSLVPVERSVEARSEVVCLNSLVRCLAFKKAIIGSHHHHGAALQQPSPTFWVGTNGGELYVYSLNLNAPATNSASFSSPTDAAAAPPAIEGQNVAAAAAGAAPICSLIKHVKLKHGAPILGVYLVDGAGFEVTGAAATVPSTAGHAVTRLLIVTEEQLKTFNWPKLVPLRLKNKVTANEGARIRKIQMVALKHKHENSKFEPFLLVMTNHGDLQCFSCQNLRTCFKRTECIPGGPRLAVSGVLSTILTPRAEGFYLRSSSEWQRFSAGSVEEAGNLKLTCNFSPINQNCTADSTQNPCDVSDDNPNRSTADERGSSPNLHNQSINSNISVLTTQLNSTINNESSRDSIHEYSTGGAISEATTLVA